MQGVAFSLSLVPLAEIVFAQPPEREPVEPASNGGIAHIAAVPTGKWQVSLDGHGWIDLVQDGEIVLSDDFSGMAGCAIRKSVRFTLGAGPVAIQISDVEADTIGIALTPVLSADE